jgi:hypothetical protein
MSRPELKMSCKNFSLPAALLLVLFLSPLAVSQDNAAQSPSVNIRQEMLKREAANAFRRLKKTMEKDGFYSGRVALNVWRSNALDAGTFDQSKYDELKQLLYEKSVNDSLRCFNEFVLEEDFFNANFCLQTWRMHSKEIGAYDQAEYEAFLEQLADVKAAKAAQRAKAKDK